MKISAKPPVKSSMNLKALDAKALDAKKKLDSKLTVKDRMEAKIQARKDAYAKANAKRSAPLNALTTGYGGPTHAPLGIKAENMSGLLTMDIQKAQITNAFASDLALIQIHKKASLKEKLNLLDQSALGYQKVVTDTASMVGRITPVKHDIAQARETLVKLKELAYEMSQNVGKPLSNFTFRKTFEALSSEFNDNVSASQDSESFSGSSNLKTLEPNTFNYTSKNSGLQSSIEGVYLESKTRITDSQKNIWEYDTVVGEFIKLDKNFKPSTETLHIRYNKTDTTYDPAAREIQVAITDKNGDVKTLSGTLNIRGLHLKEAWLYNNFVDKEGNISKDAIHEVRENLNYVASNLDLADARIEASLSVVEFSQHTAQSHLKAIQTQRTQEQISTMKSIDKEKARLGKDMDRIFANIKHTEDIAKSHVENLKKLLPKKSLGRKFL